jgi:hypothetical protein
MDAVFGASSALDEQADMGEKNITQYNDMLLKNPTKALSSSTTGSFYINPYNYADELRTPPEIGVSSGGSSEHIMNAIGGVGYYNDILGFGQKTGLNKTDMRPMGVRYFISTGATCSNGAAMWEYIDTIPKGDILGKRVTGAMAQMGLPAMQGLASGMMEDARDALNPIPFFRAAMGSGYPKCKLVSLPVGDQDGQLRSKYDNTVEFVKGEVQYTNGVPTQSRWVQDKDGSGAPIFLERVDFESAPKMFFPDGSKLEGFGNNKEFFWEDFISKKAMVGLLLSGITISFLAIVLNKKN